MFEHPPFSRIIFMNEKGQDDSLLEKREISDKKRRQGQKEGDLTGLHWSCATPLDYAERVVPTTLSSQNG